MENVHILSAYNHLGSFNIFYFAGVLIGCLIVIREAYRRKWPLVPWLIILCWGIVFAVIGSKALVVSAERWGAALGNLQIPATTGKTYLGWILGGYIGVLIARYFFRMRQSVGDAFAFAIPVGFSVVRIGCLLGGCCFGTPVHVPWAITYAPGSVAYQVHLARGLIAPGALHSLPVHPAQVYEILLLGVAVGVLWFLKRSLKKPGSLFLSYVVLHSLVRFLIECVREGSTGPGLRMVQYILLGAILLGMTIIVYKEKGNSIRSSTYWPRITPTRMVAALLALSVLVLVFGTWFTPLELKTLIIVLITASLAVVVCLLHQMRYQVSYWVRYVVIASLFVIMASNSDTIITPDTGKSSRYCELTGGTMSGSYEEMCGGVEKYSASGGGISATFKRDAFIKYRAGMQGFLGQSEGDKFRGTNLYTQIDSRYVGFCIGGAVIDEYYYRYYDYSNNSIYYRTDSRYEFLPQLAIRLGPSDIFFLEGKIYDHEPSTYPHPVIKLGIGIGFGRTSDAKLRFGISDAGFYMHPDIPVYRENIWLKPFLGYFGPDMYQINCVIGVRFNF